MGKRTHALIIKSFDEDEGVITGIATTPTTDKVGDIVEPMGAQFTLPIPLHHEHDRKDVLGQVTDATVTAQGIEFTARIAKNVSEQINEVWRRVKAGLVPFVSIGFRPIEYEQIKGGYRFTKWAWDELSLTTIPANGDAAITGIKSTQKETTIMSIAEQIRSFETKRAELLAKQDALVTKGVTLAGEDEAAYQAAADEVAQIDKHLARLREAEARQAKSAAPVAGIAAAPAATHVSVESNAPKGIDFARYAKALALSRGNPMQAVEIAKHMNYGPRVENVLKAAVAAGSTTAAGFTVLVEPQLMTAEFIELLRPATIVGKLSLRPVPQDIRLPRATTGTSASWVGEGKPAPVTNAAFSDLEVGAHKIGGIAVFTEELLRRSEPAADMLVRDDLLATVANAIDLAFIDSTNAGVAGVKPASPVNGATSAAASGTTAAKVRDDVKAAYLAAATANQPLSAGAWIMHPATALSLQMMVNGTTGLREFPGIDFVSGGTFEGLPVIVSTNVQGDALAGYDVTLVVQSEILLAEGGLAIDASREASLEMDGAPTHDSTTPTAAQLVSLWQTGSVAIKAIRGITWTKRRPTAVYRISAAKYA